MITVTKVLGLATVQDAGRFGFASQGVPRSGFLVPALAHAANAAAGNEPGAPCVEIFGRFIGVAESDVTVADERGARRDLRAGEELVVEPDARLRVRYLAIAGGVDAPIFLGSRSTLASAGLGVALRPGAHVRTAGKDIRDRDRVAPLSLDGRIRIVLGPDPGGEALRGIALRISPTSDRTGTRLEANARLPTSSGTLPSSPTVIGAIQLPHGGSPIVIGPDGPVTGGYPIVAVIASVDLDAFHTLPLGSPVVFS